MNEIFKNKFKNLSERQDRPLGKKGDKSVKALAGLDLSSWLQELSLGPKHSVRDKFKVVHFFMKWIFFVVIEKPECNRRGGN